MDEFDKGADVDRTVVLRVGTTILPTTDLTTIEVRVFSVLLRILGTYSLAAGTVTKVAPNSSGQIFFVVPATTTLIARALKYFYRIKTTETNLDFPTGIRTRFFTGWCFELKSTK